MTACASASKTRSRAPPIAAALAAAGCRSFDIRRTLGLAPREALEVELRFFVLAWQARHPEVELEIVA